MTGIIAFSDLAWGTRERGLPGGGRVGIASFMRIVDEADPAIVIFAGDAAYDRCSRSGLDETEVFVDLLRDIAAAGRHCIVVEGNNDNARGTYGRVREAAEASPFLHEVSGGGDRPRHPLPASPQERRRMGPLGRRAGRYRGGPRTAADRVGLLIPRSASSPATTA